MSVKKKMVPAVRLTGMRRVSLPGRRIFERGYDYPVADDTEQERLCENVEFAPCWIEVAEGETPQRISNDLPDDVYPFEGQTMESFRALQASAVPPVGAAATGPKDEPKKGEGEQ